MVLAQIESTPFSNQIFVFTGSLKKLKRSKAKEIILKLGAETSNTINKNTSYVIAGKNAGSKLKKAQELDINIINENEFLRIIKMNNLDININP